MRSIFIVNPSAGLQTGETAVSKAISELPEEMAASCQIYITQSPKDATEYVQSCCQSLAEETRFIACGGDGTLNEVVNGMAAAIKKDPEIEDLISLTCYPCGSGNDFVKAFGGAKRFLNIPSLITAPTQKLDLLKIGSIYADNAVHFGLDTAVASSINDYRAKHGHGGKSAYTYGVIKALIRNMRTNCKVTADGELLDASGVILLCTLCNGQYVGGSFRAAPRSLANDGLIEVCLVKPISRFRFVKLISAYTKGQHLDREDMADIIVYRRAKSIRVQGDPDFAFSVDGEVIHQSDITVDIVPGILNLAVPTD